jgi:hypothetical protein
MPHPGPDPAGTSTAYATVPSTVRVPASAHDPGVALRPGTQGTFTAVYSGATARRFRVGHNFRTEAPDGTLIEVVALTFVDDMGDGFFAAGDRIIVPIAAWLAAATDLTPAA